MVPSRQTAEERRTAVLAAAITEFARSGYAGTSTETIAARAGISQPYLFRLFGTKKDLFVATYDLVGLRIINELTAASEGLEGEEAKIAMGEAYLQLHDCANAKLAYGAVEQRFAREKIGAQAKAKVGEIDHPAPGLCAPQP